MIDIYGTLGPCCDDVDILYDMFREGMTGIRINLSHIMLKDCAKSIHRIKNAADKNGVSPKILIDMQGPELRIGNISSPVSLSAGDVFSLGKDGLPLDNKILRSMIPGQNILLDDGKIAATVVTADEDIAKLKITRGGTLSGRKSITLVGTTVDMPPLSECDLENIKIAFQFGVTGVMQPFVRSADDLMAVREALDANGGEKIRLYAKVENQMGIDNLESFFPYTDEIVIARGDLGNAVPLWDLPGIQKTISQKCNKNDMPFMVVTQMLSSMEHSKIPTRAEVSDIYNAVLDGASSIMVTGETAIGENPVEVIQYLSKTANSAEKHLCT